MQHWKSGKRPTMSDVARAAGVSSATVSRVLNGKEWVSAATKGQVLEAIARTGYTANRQAQSLATGKSGSVAFLLQAGFGDLFSDPTFSKLLDGVASELSARRVALVLLVAGSEQERVNVEEYVRSGHVDGVIVVSSHDEDPMLGRLVESGIPLASVGLPLGYEGRVSSVSVDELGSAVTAVRHLQARGCQRIAHISGPLDTPGGRFRAEGFAQVVGAGAADLMAAGDWSILSGRECMAELLERDRSIDGLFAASDSLAAGAMLELREAGLTVPGDVAVVGFDDSGLAEATTPTLSTMRQPWADLTSGIVDLLLGAIDGESPRQVVLPAELVQRESA